MGRGRLRGEGRARGRDGYISLSLSRNLSGVKDVGTGQWPSTGCQSPGRERDEFTWGAAWVSEPTGKGGICTGWEPEFQIWKKCK